jgi:alpha-tubulin suppressor-like RCC1 family protein
MQGARRMCVVAVVATAVVIASFAGAGAVATPAVAADGTGSATSYVSVSSTEHYLARQASDGTVWAWGDNFYGQLGDGTTTDRDTPQQVSGLTDVTKVKAGQYHSLAVKSDGTVWAWGWNKYGQLGDGTTADRYRPAQVKGLTGVVDVAAEHYQSLALKSDGTIWAWGGNPHGQLGDGTTTNRLTPVRVSGLTQVTAVGAGLEHGLALTADGSVWAWGANVYGQLGDGTTTGSLTPKRNGLTGVAVISAGRHHNLAIQNGGAVGWGLNIGGQLGDGTTTIRLSPVGVSGLGSGVTTIAAAHGHGLASRSDGTAVAWGWNAYGQLGDGTKTDRLTPVTVQGLTDVRAFAGGLGQSFAVTSRGYLHAWGYNPNGELGYGTTGDDLLNPGDTMLRGIGSSVSTASFHPVAAGLEHTLMIATDGKIRARGINDDGQLGDGTTTASESSCGSLKCTVEVKRVDRALSVSAGRRHSLALDKGGTVWAWGDNLYYQLGDGKTTDRTTPVKVANFRYMTGIAAGGFHSLALGSNGWVWAWGYNGDGQIGDGTTTSRSQPVMVRGGLSGVTAIAAGTQHSLALREDGHVYAWGRNSAGQVGDGTTTNRSTPVPVAGLSGVVAIAAGSAHSLALTRDGSVYAWGHNGYGQLGDGTTTNRSTPVKVSRVVSAMEIAAGGSSSYAAAENGTKVWSWGNDADGQLSTGTTGGISTTPEVISLNPETTTPVIALAAAQQHAVFLLADVGGASDSLLYESGKHPGLTFFICNPAQQWGSLGAVAAPGLGLAGLLALAVLWNPKTPTDEDTQDKAISWAFDFRSLSPEIDTTPQAEEQALRVTTNSMTGRWETNQFGNIAMATLPESTFHFYSGWANADGILVYAGGPIGARGVFNDYVAPSRESCDKLPGFAAMRCSYPTFMADPVRSLVVLLARKSALDHPLRPELGSVADGFRTAGAATVVGFEGDLDLDYYDAWASEFWYQFSVGATVATAVDRATQHVINLRGSAGGFETAQILGNASLINNFLYQ